MNFSSPPTRLLLCATAAFSAAGALANPAGLTVAAGTATAVAAGTTLNIAAGHNAVLDWQTFNIAAGETVNFSQPSQVAVVWNRIADARPSQVWGNLNANGIVVLMNQNGFYFGPNSCVNVGGFVAAGAWVIPPAAGGGGAWTYQGPPPAASIINYGEIKATAGGSLFLVAEKIENHGILSAPDGTLGLYAGKEVMLSERPDGRGLSATVALPSGAIDNFGKLAADAGTIALHARVVNQGGLVQANSVRERNGVIELFAGDAINLGADSVMQANGDASGASAGGQIVIKSANVFSDDPASRIEVRGGVHGGAGGAVELCALHLPAIRSQLDGSATTGSRGGSLLIDPYDIYLYSGSGNTSSGSFIDAYDFTDDPLLLDVTRAFRGQNFSQVTLQALHDITLADNLNWNLNTSIGSAVGSTLTLMAGHNINFGSVDADGAIVDPDNGARIVSGRTTVAGQAVAGTGWNVNLFAGVDFSLATPVAVAGDGSILNSKIQSLAGGSINLTAGKDVLMGGGFMRVINGGDINITALSGDVDAGHPASSGQFRNTYSVSDNVIDTARGGIATEKSGNVTITAGGNIRSLSTTIATLGVGDLSLVAGGDVSGNFYVRNGTGTVRAGGNIGDGASGATFGLTRGGWNISAPTGNIFINEIYNFNGAYGAEHLFSFAPDAYVNLTAGNRVGLLGDSLLSSVVGRVYPPRLNIQAGAGGVTLGDGLVLFPSASGRLAITTSAGGSLGQLGAAFSRLIVSDGDPTDFTTFADGHAATPLHLNQAEIPVQLDIAGNLNNVFLRSPGRADIRVRGNAYNFSFEGQNLAAAESTRIAIDGRYTVRAASTSVATGIVDLDVFQNQLYSVDSILGGKLYYDSVTHRLEFYGRMTAIYDANNVLIGGDLFNLLHPTVYVLDRFNQQILDANGRPLTRPAVFTTDTAAIMALYLATQDLPLPAAANYGLALHGPGTFDISARDMDLGSSGGIRSIGAFNLANNNTYQSLGAVMIQGNTLLPGAAINLSLAGDLNLTSSQIMSSGGGGIHIISGGAVNVGVQNAPFVNDSTPRGIYTGHGGSVSIEASGDINVNGSRIASYDGGDVRVISTGGAVNAGDGAKGFFYLNSYAQIVFERDSLGNVIPGSIQVAYDQTNPDRFFGSGILALTSGNSDTRIGNVDVRAYGDINAGSGGILQLAFNTVDQSAATLNLLSTHGDIHAGNSGVLGRNVTANADRGSVDGIFVAAGNAEIRANQNVNITALAGGNASVSGGGSVSGSVVGGGNVSVAGADVSASAISTGGSVSGNTSGATTAFAGVAAPTAQKTGDEADKAIASNSNSTEEDEETKKKKNGGGNSPVLAQKVSRVTVILPKKS